MKKKKEPNRKALSSFLEFSLYKWDIARSAYDTCYGQDSSGYARATCYKKIAVLPPHNTEKAQRPK